MEAQIDEWKRLLKLAEVAEVKAEILRQIASIERTQAATGPVLAGVASVKEPASKEEQFDTAIYSPLTDFAWADEGPTVKLYAFFKGKALSKADVRCSFTETGFDLRCLGDRNLRLAVKNLCKKIKPSASSFKVSKDKVTVELKKESPSHWDSLYQKENKLLKPQKPKEDDSDVAGDPGASLMKLMKDLYQQGDDDMKRTIAKAWTESQEKKMKGQGGGDENDGF